MKNLLIIGAILFMFSCAAEESNNNETEVVVQPNIVTDFIANTKSLEKSTEKQQIVRFTEVADSTAERSLVLTKESAERIFAEAKNYKHCIIITGEHTVVKVTDLTKRQASGSWAIDMPYGEGYVKKGTLTFKEDYVNNIFGRPDSQKRKVYLFN